MDTRESKRSRIDDSDISKSSNFDNNQEKMSQVTVGSQDMRSIIVN